MTKTELEKQLRKCERLLKKYTKCSGCNGKGKRSYEMGRSDSCYGVCYSCHGSGTTTTELAAYWNTKK